MSETGGLERETMAAIAAAADEAALEAVRVAALGKKGAISELLKSLGNMGAEERKAKGAEFNALRDRVAEAIAARRAQFAEQELSRRLTSERVDVTLPARPEAGGRIHPVSQVLDELIQIFADMGFGVAEGPDIEDEEHNFTLLNMPEDHPARQMHDTFYLNPSAKGARTVLRTHTSPVQIRTMMSAKPPIRVIAPGRTYRRDSDQTHTPMFHQVEALVVDESTHMGHLKWTIEEFCKAFFELDEVALRFRPSYFPFTEPSAEADIRCDRRGGGIVFGQGEDWLEILGCGMVHPKVIENCGLDPERYQGFALGAGLDRLAMLKYGMKDLRPFFDSDLRWLRHYGFAALDVPTLATGLAR